MHSSTSTPAVLATRFGVGAAVICLALNLRPVMAGVGPLLDQIERSAGLSHTGAGLLTTLPVAAMGACALFGWRLHAALGERRGTALGMALVALACAFRLAWPTGWGLLVTAALGGAGVACVQVLLPAFLKRSYGAAAGAMLGFYTTGIMGGAACAAATAAGLADRFGLGAALGVWALPAALALALWLGSTTPAAHLVPASPTHQAYAFWRRRRAWELLVFFGIGTGAYTLVLAWLPAYYTGLGWQRADAGYLLGGLTVTEVAAGMAVSAFAGAKHDLRTALLLALGLLSAGLACLAAAPLALALPAAGLLGLGIGALFPLTLILTVEHIDDPAGAGALAAFVQGGGYLVASLMPLVAGILRDTLSNLAHAWLVMLGGCLVLAALALRFSPATYASVSDT